jgi:hypothetical protein
MKLQLVGKTQAYCSNIGPLNIEVWTTSRDGSHSPLMILYKYKGRWITEFEQKHRQWRLINIGILFKALYSRPANVLKDLVYDHNPFLKMISKIK